MAIGDVFPYSVPSVGSSGPGFATTINNILTEVISRLSVKVPLASIDFNSTANFAGSTLTNVGFITLTNTLSTPGASPVNRLTAFSGDLWYVSPSGPIQLTTGSLLNSAAIGGITGDYGGANPAQFRFVDADQRYDAYDNFGTSTFALVRARGFDISAAPVSPIFARLAFGGSVTRTYTLPNDPASTADARPVYMDSAGNLSVGHGSKILRFSAIGALPITGSFGTLSPSNLGNGLVANTDVASQSFVKALDNLLVGSVITNMSIELNKSTTTASSFSLIRSINGGVGVSLAGVSSIATGAQSISVALGAAETVAANASYYVLAGLNASLNDKWSGVGLTINLPR
jgi:hypothetical protein